MKQLLRSALILALNRLGGVDVGIKATDWETAQDQNLLWYTRFMGYRPGIDLLWVDWANRKLEIEKDYYLKRQ